MYYLFVSQFSFLSTVYILSIVCFKMKTNRLYFCFDHVTMYYNVCTIKYVRVLVRKRPNSFGLGD